jgi:hypothetical protein
MRSQSGKGDDPRNVGPNFQKNFLDINWGPIQYPTSERRTSTKRIYTYGKTQPGWPSIADLGGPK